MAEMTTTLTKFSQSGNAVTYTAPGHTVEKPKLLLQKRKLASGSANSVAESVATVLYGTADTVSSALLAARIQLSTNCRVPVGALTADIDAAIALHRDFINSDAFVRLVKTQVFVN